MRQLKIRSAEASNQDVSDEKMVYEVENRNDFGSQLSQAGDKLVVIGSYVLSIVGMVLW